jgi:hypothetical protein
MQHFGNWRYTVDPGLTRERYALAKAGKADVCDCFDCRNYRNLRDSIFDGAALEFLLSVGIDHRKESENYRVRSTSPGLHEYGGWFHFVGELVTTGDFPLVQLTRQVAMAMCTKSAPALREFGGVSLVQLEFQLSDIPWTILGCEPIY